MHLRSSLYVTIAIPSILKAQSDLGFAPQGNVTQHEPCDYGSFYCALFETYVYDKVVELLGPETQYYRITTAELERTALDTRETLISTTQTRIM